VRLGDGRPGGDGVEGGDEGERPAEEVVGAARAGEVDGALVEAEVGLDLVEHRHDHLDLVVGRLAPDVLRLGEGDDGDVSSAVSRHQTCSR
jgi:hypothetical protein